MARARDERPAGGRPVAGPASGRPVAAAGRRGPRQGAVDPSRQGFDRPALAADLDDGLAELGLDLPAADRARLLDYLALLLRWNSVYNLTAIRDPQAMLVQHLFDSLAVVRPLRERLGRGGAPVTALDVGSGAGLPAIPMAIAWPELRITTVEPVGKKSAFIQQSIGTLGLAPRTRAVNGRIEHLADRPNAEGPPALVISRAFASLADFVQGLQGVAGPDTLVAAMKGVWPDDEIAALPAGWQPTERIELTVPRLDAQRHLVLMRRT